jgi:hypothetical protein
MTRTIVCVLVCAHSCLYAQPGKCYVGETNVGCPTDPAQNPNMQTYIGNLTSAFATMHSVIDKMVTPKILVAAEIPPANSGKRASDPVNCDRTNNCIFSTAGPSSVSGGISHYIDAAVTGAGATALDYNFDPLYWTQAPEYQGTAKPKSPSWMTYQMNVDMQFLGHAKMAEIIIRMAAAPLSSTYQACGLNPATMSAQQASDCVDPMLQAAIRHLHTAGIEIFAMLPWHEPAGITAQTTGQTFSETDWVQMGKSGCKAVHQADPDILCGSGFQPSEGSYVTAYVNDPSPDINIIGLETYAGVDTAAYANVMNAVARQCASAAAKHIRCDNTEGAPPRHVPATAPNGNENQAYEGCAWEDGERGWQTYGVHAAWANVVSRFLSANGVSSFTRFPTQPFAGYYPDPRLNCNANGPDSVTAQVMARLSGTTTAGHAHAANTTWGAAGLAKPAGLQATVQ